MEIDSITGSVPTVKAAAADAEPAATQLGTVEASDEDVEELLGKLVGVREAGGDDTAAKAAIRASLAKARVSGTRHSPY